MQVKETEGLGTPFKAYKQTQWANSDMCGMPAQWSIATAERTPDFHPRQHCIGMAARVKISHPRPEFALSQFIFRKSS